MKRIVILGCENSHADSFLRFIKEREEFSDIHVTGIYSDEREPCERLRDTFGVPVMTSPHEAVGQVDGVMVTARHGDNHLGYVRPYLDSRVPLFMDKPITVSVADALELGRALRDGNIPVTGGSSLRHDEFLQTLREEHLASVDGPTVGGIIRAPLASASPYGGFFFYAQHLVEMVGEVFGRYPTSVRATPWGDTTTVLFRYPAYQVTGHFDEWGGQYYAARFSKEGSHGAPLALTPENDWFYKEFAEYAAILRGAPQKITYSDLVAPVFVLNAIKDSLDSGREEAVEFMEEKDW